MTGPETQLQVIPNSMLPTTLKNYYFCVCMFWCEYMPSVSGCPWESKEGIGFLEAGVISSCETPDEGVGNETGPFDEQEVFSTIEPSL